MLAAQDDDISHGFLLLPPQALGFPPFPVDQELGVPFAARVLGQAAPFVNQSVYCCADLWGDVDEVVECWWDGVLVVFFFNHEGFDF